jgi:hypothetical protein
MKNGSFGDMMFLRIEPKGVALFAASPEKTVKYVFMRMNCDRIVVVVEGILDKSLMLFRAGLPSPGGQPGPGGNAKHSLRGKWRESATLLVSLAGGS